MSRRHFLGSLVGGAAGLVAERRRPANIVLILADDLGWTDLGCFGSSFYQTPNIDRLARQGMRFTSAYAACPVCSPTRASILTGKYPARLHLTDWIPGRTPPGSGRPAGLQQGHRAPTPGAGDHPEGAQRDGAVKPGTGAHEAAPHPPG